MLLTLTQICNSIHVSRKNSITLGEFLIQNSVSKVPLLNAPLKIPTTDTSLNYPMKYPFFLSYVCTFVYFHIIIFFPLPYAYKFDKNATRFENGKFARNSVVINLSMDSLFKSTSIISFVTDVDKISYQYIC